MLVQRDNFSGTSGIWTYDETNGTVAVSGGELRMLHTSGGQNTVGAYLTNTFNAANGDNMEATLYMQNPDGEMDMFHFTRQAFSNGAGVGFQWNNAKTYTIDYPDENAVELDSDPLPTSAPGRHHRVRMVFTPSEEIEFYRSAVLERTKTNNSDISAGQAIRCRFVSNYYDPNELRVGHFARWTADDRNPPPPDTLTATAQSATEILLEWNDVVTAINGDSIRIEMDDGGGFTEVAFEALAVGEYLVEDLEPSTEYVFRIRSRVDVNGTDYNSTYSATATETTDDPPNEPPVCDAGPDQVINWPTNTATLAGGATDDGFPDPPATVTFAWTVITKPVGSTVSFDDDTDPETGIEVDMPGEYVLRLTADDSEETDTDDVTIAFNQAPLVNAGPDQTVYRKDADLTDPVQLAGSVDDDLLPDPPGALTVLWTKISGPGTVNFADDTDPATTATFSAKGVYVLQLEADDGDQVQSDQVTITLAENPYVRVPLITSGASVQGDRFARVKRSKTTKRIP